MNIALLGYGKMGVEIEKIALERGHTICGKITSKNIHETETVLQHADAAIEFSRPETAVENILKCFDAGVPAIVGTTGWYDQFEEVKQQLQQHDATLLYATNFSLGVNITFKVNEYLAKIMNKQNGYAPAIHEIHHIHKLDAPSGTACTLAEGLIAHTDSKRHYKLDGEGKNDELRVTADRINEVPGTHIVSYESEIDKIELKHEAKTRAGFALGAVLAAEYCRSNKGLLTMNDLLDIN